MPGEGQLSMVLLVLLSAAVVTVVSRARLAVFGDASPGLLNSVHCRSTLVTVSPSARNETSCRCVLVTVAVDGELAVEAR